MRVGLGGGDEAVEGWTGAWERDGMVCFHVETREVDEILGAATAATVPMLSFCELVCWAGNLSRSLDRKSLRQG